MEIKEIFIEKIKTNPYQPREEFDKEKLQELAESILSNGLINPITVRKENGDYLLVSGERRLKANKIAGLKTIIAIVKEYKDNSHIAIESLIENTHREDLSEPEKAQAMKKIWELLGKPMSKNHPNSPDFDKLAGMLCISNSVIQEHFDYLGLIPEVKEAIKKKKIAMSSATRHIARLPESKQKVIIKEAMKREDGIGRAEVQEIVENEIIYKDAKQIKIENTINDTAMQILNNITGLRDNIDDFSKDNLKDLRPSMANQLLTSSGVLLFKSLPKLFQSLKDTGAKTDKRIIELMKLK